MPFVLTVPQKVTGETTYAGSIIARESFTIQVLAVDNFGYPLNNYNGTVPVYANSPTDDKAYNIGTVTFNAGRGTSSNLTITSVFNDEPSRKITVSDGTNSGNKEVGVWFKGDATNFNGSTKSYCANGNQPPKYYVALPAYKLCGKSVKVHNPNANKTLSGRVWDVGPFFDANACGEDRYWATGKEPKSITDKGKKVCEVCNVSCDQYPRTINGAIIDLSPDMLRDLGGSGTITNALWRFE